MPAAEENLGTKIEYMATKQSFQTKHQLSKAISHIFSGTVSGVLNFSGAFQHFQGFQRSLATLMSWHNQNEAS